MKELEALISINVFKKILSSLCKARSKGHQFAPLRMIFDVKVELRRNVRIVIGGHVANSSGHYVYANHHEVYLSQYPDYYRSH